MQQTHNLYPVHYIMVCSFFSLVFFASHSISSVSKLYQTGMAVVYSVCLTSLSIITPFKIHIRPLPASVHIISFHLFAFIDPYWYMSFGYGIFQ